jgi:2-polyprenyl-3-methyl-5-hydroxy-6-metoxy-1,4-benzoquinol methylase
MDRLRGIRHKAATASAGISNADIYHAIRDEVSSTRAHGAILDYGAGTGTLTRMLWSSRGFTSIHAIDLMPRPDDLPGEIHWRTCDLNESTGYPPEHFDVIVAAEVIEHLENPRAVTREWWRILRRDGHLIFSTPNNQSLRSLIALMIRGHFVAFGDTSYPAHITALLRKDMVRIVSEAGFSAPQFRYSNAGGIPGFPRVKWQAILGFLARGSLFSDNVICVCRRVG